MFINLFIIIIFSQNKNNFDKNYSLSSCYSKLSYKKHVGLISFSNDLNEHVKGRIMYVFPRPGGKCRSPQLLYTIWPLTKANIWSNF